MPGRPSKTLRDHVRDGTFESRRSEHRKLLTSHDVPWPALAGLQQRYRAAETEFEQRAIAREFERLVMAAHAEAAERAQDDANEFGKQLTRLGPPHSAKRTVAFFERFYRWDDGTQWKLDRWQKDFLRDLYARTPDDRRIYKEAGLGLPRGQAKTPIASGVCTATVASVEDVRTHAYQIAGSKRQAAIGTEYSVNFVTDSELEEVLRARRRSIERRDGRGSYTVLGSDGRLSHGLHGRYVAVLDELWLFKSAAEVQGYTAIESALHKDPESFMLWISAAGYDRRSLLGRKYKRGLTCPEISTRRQGFLTIGRDPDAGYLMWWYGMPDGYELDLENDKAVMKALKLANPGSWTDHHEMLRSLRRAMSGQLEEDDDIGDELEWLRLCLNFWTASRGAWFKPGVYRRLADRTVEIPRGADIYVAVDAAHSYDTTAVTWAWYSTELEKIVTRRHVFSVRPNVPAHTFVDDFYDAAGNEHVAERLIHELADVHGYRVREVVGDPNYFGGELARLGQRFLTAPLFPWANEMRDYVQRYYRDVNAGRIVTDGDPIGIAHVEAVVAEKSADGYWTIKRRNQPEPIDACTAEIIANGRAQPDRHNVSVYEKRGLEVLDGPTRKSVGDTRDDGADERTGQALPYSAELAELLGLEVADDDLDDDDDLEDDDE